MKPILVILFVLVALSGLGASSIVSSTFSTGIVQPGGRVEVTELHTDHLAIVHRVIYLSGPGDDRAAIMTARAVTLLESLKHQEVSRILGNLEYPIVNYATMAELLTRWRNVYTDAKGELAGALADWILDHLEGGVWTDAQLANLFGASGGEWTNIKSRLTTNRNRWNSMNSSIGK